MVPCREEGEGLFTVPGGLREPSNECFHVLSQGTLVGALQPTWSSRGRYYGWSGRGKVPTGQTVLHSEFRRRSRASNGRGTGRFAWQRDTRTGRFPRRLSSETLSEAFRAGQCLAPGCPPSQQGPSPQESPAVRTRQHNEILTRTSLGIVPYDLQQRLPARWAQWCCLFRCIDFTTLSVRCHDAPSFPTHTLNLLFHPMYRSSDDPTWGPAEEAVVSVPGVAMPDTTGAHPGTR